MVTPFHLLRLWFIQLRYAASRELAFRANFFAWVVVELAWFVLQLAFVGVVYQHVESVAGWSRQEMIVLVATNQLIQQIFTAFLMPGLVKLPELVRDGKLDFVLLKPAPPQFLISTSHLEIGPLANAAIAAVVGLLALHDLHIAPTLSSFLAYLLLVLAGLLTQLTDTQLHDVFVVARFARRSASDDGPPMGPTVENWVDAFKIKRAAIVDHSCPAGPDLAR